MLLRVNSIIQVNSISLLRKVLQKIEQIKRSTSGSPNFESHEEESCDVQLAFFEKVYTRFFPYISYEIHIWPNKTNQNRPKAGNHSMKPI
jgi:hypothetical protein